MLRGSAGIAAIQICFGKPNCAATALSSQLAAAFSNKPSFAAADQSTTQKLRSCCARSFNPMQNQGTATYFLWAWPHQNDCYVQGGPCHAVVELASVCDGGGRGQAMKRQVGGSAGCGQLPAAADHTDFES